ncbi:MAG: pyrroline-5-carboxylate reductase [Acutalibacteraceae bacterium]|jgi:pyrroline-5-carboxylate reductase
MEGSIGFIGAGNMASAIIGGMIRAGLAEPQRIVVCDKSVEKCAPMQAKGCRIAADAAETVHLCQTVFLAVKPQNYAEVLESVRSAVTPDKLFVSIAAGISTAYVERESGCGKVIRVMPNTPLLLGAGATALCRGKCVPDDEFEQVREIFEASGMVEVLPEEQMNAVIAVNGSSPAYVYLMAKAMVDGAAEQGIDPETALRLVAGTLAGSAKMLTDSGHSPDELIRMVSSPGGTTLKALDVLYECNFESALKDAMQACTRRAEELGR